MVSIGWNTWIYRSPQENLLFPTMKREEKCTFCRCVKAGSILGLTPTPRMRLWIQTVRAMWLNWMAGWLAGQATLECRVFCLSERGVGQGENAIDDSREKERNSRKCSLSFSPRSPTFKLPFSFSLSLCPSFSVSFCVWEPSPWRASLSEAAVPRHNHCFVLPCEHTPLLSSGAHVCQGHGSTGLQLLFLSTSLLLYGCVFLCWVVNCFMITLLVNKCLVYASQFVNTKSDFFVCLFCFFQFYFRAWHWLGSSGHDLGADISSP